MPLVVSCKGQLNWVSYCPEIAIKEQALANFVVEFVHYEEIEPERVEADPKTGQEEDQPWFMDVDEFSNNKAGGAWLVLTLSNSRLSSTTK